jgi:hypothetical protein
MKKFCFCIIFVLVILGSVFAQEDWTEFRWPERSSNWYLAFVTINDSGRDKFRDNWERLIPMLSWEEVTDYDLKSTELLRFYENSSTPIFVTVKQVIQVHLTEAKNYNHKYNIAFCPTFYNDKHLYIVSWVSHVGRNLALRARAFLSPVGPEKDINSVVVAGAFILEALKNLNCGFNF